jgi:uncharacterized protein (DUF2236 family)
VAAGVAEHSNYREYPWGRLYRTLDLTAKIVFGERRTAEEAARRIRAAHERVQGVTAENGGRYSKGTPIFHPPQADAIWCAGRGPTSR